MGRVKLEIKRIENTNNRLVTFAKRKAGLIKKAQELSTLCDIDVALIMFSPGNKLTQYATNSRVEEIILRYANVPEAERRKRKMENLEQLNRAIRKLKGETEATKFSRSFVTIEDLKGDLNNMEFAQEDICRLQSENENAQKRLRLYQGDDAVLDACNYEDLLQMEVEVQRIIEKVRLRKQEIQIAEEIRIPGHGPYNFWTDKELEMIKEEAGGSIPGSYLGAHKSVALHPSLDLNELEFHHPAMFMSGFRLGLQQPNLTNLEDSLVEDDNKGEVPAFTNNYQPFEVMDSISSLLFSQMNSISSMQDGSLNNLMELDFQDTTCALQCESQADSSQ